ncbi:Rgp1-domain-containing protein [Neocallimastix lanati (nom. inval.)]|uniref:Rgp1-domain-containing protein n=1 Tax=Neocallimastix californiae TaxID=1754190 RepID=A0A1Y1ZH14_9FUNG|nr:Rgp1-domain-containing protein [Neocallimastix sp. JGI-2020a]ORY09552.1 Rgp1-domain-containing protein [Neocallimastix californiae]|eukprot:ORY09552.1 Rgp1-domain-containing protein [Neocallimastix californiae]
MPIIVKASFPKKNKDALFWGGEEVTCTIKITNSTSDSLKNSQDKKVRNVVVPPSNDVFVKSKSVVRRRKSIESVKTKKVGLDKTKKKNEKSALGMFGLKKIFRRSMSFLLNDDESESTTINLQNQNEVNKGKQEINESSSIDDTNNTLVQKSNISPNSTIQSNINTMISEISSPNTIITNFDYDDTNNSLPSASTDAYPHNTFEIKEISGKGTQINIQTKSKSGNNSNQNPSSNTNLHRTNSSGTEIKRINIHSDPHLNRKNSDDASSQDSHQTASSNNSSFKKLNNYSNSSSLYSLDKSKTQYSMSNGSLNTDFEIKMMGKCTLDGNHINLNLFESVKSKIRYGSKIGGGGSIGYDMNKSNDPRYNRIDIPIYSTAPGILFCDLTLEPGQTKIFDYSIVLPSSIPPTYYGKSIKINYSVHIGIQKTPLNVIPYSITLPFKVFSYVENDGSKPAYDIMNPVIINKDLSTISQRNTESLDLIHSPLPYTPIETSHSIKIDDGFSFRNVCGLCQQASKVSYEICKDNENVAQLLFTRSVYRLGESIIGIIKFKTNALRCYQVTTYLETHEQIEYPYALRSKGKGGRVTKKVIAQQQDFCLNNSKIFVELPIPLYATPEFNINAVNLNWFLRFEFITSSNEKIMNIDSKNNNFIHASGITNSNVEYFDCKVPIKVYGSKYGTQNSKASEYVSIYI